MSLTWTEHDPFFSGTPVSRLAHGDGLWVAAGGSTSSRLSTSPNGAVWTPRTFPGTDFVSGVEHNGAGLWVAVDFDGKLASSPDAITWTLRTNPTLNAHICVGYGAGLWVVGGVFGAFITSSDGINWTSHSPSFGGGVVSAIKHNGAGLWVTVGSGIHTSPDGINWTPRTSPFGIFGVNDVDYGAGLWVAAGFNGEIATSPDGINWTLRTSTFSGTQDVQGVAHNGVDEWVIVGEDGLYATSPDGITWTNGGLVLSPSTTRLRDVAHNGNGLFLAGTQAGEVATASSGPVGVPLFWTERVGCEEF